MVFLDASTEGDSGEDHVPQSEKPQQQNGKSGEGAVDFVVVENFDGQERETSVNSKNSKGCEQSTDPCGLATNFEIGDEFVDKK